MVHAIRSLLLTALGTLLPKVAQKVVVYSQPDFEDGALAILTELCARGYRPLVLTNQRFVKPPTSPTLPGLKTVPKNSLRGRWHFLTAEVVVFTHPPFHNHRPARGQRTLNIWHGEPLVKAVALWDGGAPVPSTVATSISELGKAFRCAEFGLRPDQVVAVGAPRNDRLLRADRGVVRRAALPEPGVEHLFLWLPTYRVATSTGRVDGVAGTSALPFEQAELEPLDLWLTEHHARILVKGHQVQGTDAITGRYRAISAIDDHWLAARQMSLYELMKGTDGLITDASSVWIDYLLVNRPVIWAFPDVDAYRRARAIHMEPYEQCVPGAFVKTVPALADALSVIVAGADESAAARDRMVTWLYAHMDDRSSARALDAIALPATPVSRGL